MKKSMSAYVIMIALSILIVPASGQSKNQDNQLSEKEKKEGWKLLFDGSTSAGWMNAKTMKFPVNGWVISNGEIRVSPETKKAGGGGDIVTTEKYKNFELSVDFKLPKGGNSGIKYFVDIEKNNGSLSGIGCEYQVLDNENHPDAKAGKAGNRTLAGLYDLIPPKNVKDNGLENWNTAKIVVKDNKVQHWLNGQMTVEYERGNQAWKDLVATSKFKTSPGFGEVVEGRILLQDHTDPVSFKNIKIREIK